jgi:signal transduction histidine kinase/DNA-binding response OmpR family regulator
MGFVHRLSISRKLLLLGMLVLAATCVPLYLHLSLSQRLIVAAEREREGVQPARLLMRLVQQTQQHRGLSSAWLGGFEGALALHQAKRKEVDAAILQFDALIESRPPTAGLVPVWRDAVNEWRGLARGLGAPGVAVTENIERHTRLIGLYFKVLDLLLDDSGLILDPHSDTYHLMSAALTKLPHAIESLGQMRAQGASMLAAGDFTAERRAVLMGQGNQSRALLEQALAAFEKSFDANSQFRQVLAAPLTGLTTPTQTALALAQDGLVRGHPVRTAPSAYIETFTRAINGAYELEEAALNLMQVKLMQRVEELRFTQFMQLSFMLLLLAGVGALAHRWWLRPLIGRLSDVREGLVRIGAGDCDTPVAIGVDDEFGQILADVENMRRRLKATIGALNEQREAAQVAERVKGEFLANMSHEIRTPLNAIVGLTDLALRSELSPKLRDYLSNSRMAAESLQALIDQVLDFSKIEAGRLDLEIRAFRLDDVLQRVTVIVGQKAQQRGLELMLNTGRLVQQQLVGDAHRLTQVLINLCSNAVKFTEEGEIVVMTVQQVAVDDTYCTLRFSVHDTGIGMSAAQIDRVFHPFTQADSSTTRQYGGTGLGLAISKQLVEAMGGQIGVLSTLGVGSEFFFTATFGRGELLPAPELPAWPRVQGLQVLVVDDSIHARDIFKALLEDLGCVACLADSAASALRWLDDPANPGIDLVLLDWKMPVTDGFQAARLLRRHARMSHQPPVIMITGYGDEALARRVRDEGFEACLTKPVTTSSLLDTIVSAFGDGERRPFAPPEVSAPVATATSTAPAPLRTELQGRHVLLVEDNEFNQLVATELLRGVAGVHVTVAHHGEQALELLRMAHFDAVLMDVQMPIMDGYETTRRIRDIPTFAHLPVIAMTAHATHKDREACIEAGMNDYITKPFDPEELFAMLVRWID